MFSAPRSTPSLRLTLSLLLTLCAALPLTACKSQAPTLVAPTQLSDPDKALAAKVDKIRVVDVEDMRKEESNPNHPPIVLNVTQDASGKFVKADTLLLLTSRPDPTGKQRDGLIPWHVDDLKPTPASAAACACPCDPFRRRFRKAGPVGLCPYPAGNTTVPVCVDTTPPDTPQEIANESLRVSGLPALPADRSVNMCSYKFSIIYADGDHFDPHLQINRNTGTVTGTGTGAGSK